LGCSGFGSNGSGMHLSMTSNLLFGLLQPSPFLGWRPVHVFAEDGLNSLPGVQLQQGADNHVLILSFDIGLDRLFLFQRIPLRFTSSFSDYAPTICNSTFRIRCHNRTANRRITATSAIFFFFGFRNTSS
jgi:hypothetical protein